MELSWRQSVLPQPDWVELVWHTDDHREEGVVRIPLPPGQTREAAMVAFLTEMIGAIDVWLALPVDAVSRDGRLETAISIDGWAQTVLGLEELP